MGRIGTTPLAPLAMLGLLGLGSLTALAAPPAGQREHLPSRPALDLRPPVATLLAGDRTPDTLPSLHRQILGSRGQLELPEMGSGGGQIRTPGRIEELARRVHREGLPVARLWENQSTLLHLGLNQRGKPGLWIVQKIH